MILTTRYPHVRALVLHYAKNLSDKSVLSILDKGVNSKDDAERLSYFIWRMLDEIEKGTDLFSN